MNAVTVFVRVLFYSTVELKFGIVLGESWRIMLISFMLYYYLNVSPVKASAVNENEKFPYYTQKLQLVDNWKGTYLRRLTAISKLTRKILQRFWTKFKCYSVTEGQPLLRR